jgi:hypothetical protein
MYARLIHDVLVVHVHMSVRASDHSLGFLNRRSQLDSCQNLEPALCVIFSKGPIVLNSAVKGKGDEW